MPPLPADSIHARACKLKCEKILTRPLTLAVVRKAQIKVHRRRDDDEFIWSKAKTTA